MSHTPRPVDTLFVIPPQSQEGQVIKDDRCTHYVRLSYFAEKHDTPFAFALRGRDDRVSFIHKHSSGASPEVVRTYIKLVNNELKQLMTDIASSTHNENIGLSCRLESVVLRTLTVFHNKKAPQSDNPEAEKHLIKAADTVLLRAVNSSLEKAMTRVFEKIRDYAGPDSEQLMSVHQSACRLEASHDSCVFLDAAETPSETSLTLDKS